MKAHGSVLFVKRKGELLMNQIFKKLQPYLEKEMAFSTALTLIDWDMETLAPKEAVDYTSKAVGILSQEQFSCIINPEVKKILAELKKEKELDDFELAVIKKLEKEYKKTEKISAEEMREFSELTSKAVHAWQKAKKEKDFSVYAPYLEKIITFQKKFAEYGKEEGQTLYDVLLDDYEEDFNEQVLDKFFDKLKKKIVPLLKEIEKQEEIEDSFLFLDYDEKKQEEFNLWLAEYMGFCFDKGVIAQSEHPFTTALHNHDVRITTHYYKNNLASALLSTIHEGGHALYEMGVDDKFTQSMVGGGASCGMHESQSRFFENVIGRSISFWKPIYKKLQETFPEQLGNVGVEEFVKALNKVKADFIRTEADELTYCLHIMVRYELEKQMINEDIDVNELPKLWKEKYKEYLGVEVKDDTEGILQDIHWSMGDIGYFPSYALGNAFAAQIYHQMKKDLPIEELLEKKEISKIVAYLKEHIHQYGASKDAREMLKDLTGEEFNPDYYIEYLETKFREVYGI